MATITIEIPKKILERGGSARRLLVVNPKEFEKEMWRRWEIRDVKKTSRAARREWEEKDAREAVRVMEQEKRRDKLYTLTSLKDLMKA